MKLLTVTYKLHNDEELKAKDVKDGAKYGANSFRQFKAKDTVEIVTEAGDHYFVPFHAIIWAKVEDEQVEVAPVEDANCNATCECAESTPAETPENGD